MDNQHRKITGYRDLSQQEIDMMNVIKAFGKAAEEATLNVGMCIREQRAKQQRRLHTEANRPGITADEAAVICGEANAEIARIDAAQPERWIAIARTHFQEGLMALTRAIAQPGSF